MKEEDGSVGIGALLGVLFVGLKITGYVEWSWFWVTLPFWIEIVFWLVVVGVIAALHMWKER